MCVLEFDEQAAVFTEKKVVAKKDHKCFCCRGAIKKGDSYVRHFSVFDRCPSAEKMCLSCFEMRTTFAKEHNGQYASPSGMPDLLVECIDMEGVDSEAGKRWQRELDAMDERKKLRLSQEAQ
jgi:hypothetical protein